MALKEVTSNEELQGFLGQNRNVVMCFSATWCGPCKASKPALEQMALQYTENKTKDVKFGIVYEENLGDDLTQYDITAFPTYVLYVGKREVNRVKGANMEAIVSMINQAGCLPDTGQSLGGGGEKLSVEEARARRLARLGGATTAPPPPAEPKEEEKEKAKAEEVNDVDMKEPAKEGEVEETKEGDVEMEDTEAEPGDPCAKLNAEDIKTLTESMGFALIRAQKGLIYGNGGTVEGAVEWLMQHQDDADIDEPIPKGGGVAQSYKCNECGKNLSSMANLELHANKTGHSDFEESTQAVKPLTAEEKAQKVAELKALLKSKRAEREEKEKVDDVDREKQRRFMGKEMAKTREQVEIEQRKRDAQRRKREKEEFRKERERLRAELAKDKAERMSNKGKLTSKLGVDGYKPDGIQYEVNEDGETVEVKKAKRGPSSAKIDEYIKKVSSYRAGGDGGKCLKVLLAYVGNAADNPGEDKFKSIKTDNKVFKAKIKPFVGAKQLLMAVGFAPTETGDLLVLKEDYDPQVLTDTKAKLQAAFDAYNK